jgi:hypothetical protein
MGEPEQDGGYYAFISYRHVEPDQTWAQWLHKSIETYTVPKRLAKERNLPARLQPLFRDEEEFAASSDLSESIQDALRKSRFLIVVCSPSACESEWINKEILYSRDLGREDKILSLLVSGEPSSSFPPALRELRRHKLNAPEAAQGAEASEPLAADVRPKKGVSSRRLKRAAKLRIIAGILGCTYNDLRRRDEARRTRNIIKWVALSSLLVAALAGLSYFGISQMDEAGRQEREALRGKIDLKMLEDARGEHTPFDVERRRNLDALLKEAQGVGHPAAASAITNRMLCLLPPTARQEKAQVDDVPEQFVVNRDGTRVCAIYKDRVEIRDAQTYKVLHSFKSPATPSGCETVYALADDLNDRVVYAVDYVTLKCSYRGFPRNYFVKSFDGSPPLRIKVSEQFEGFMPDDKVAQGINLRLKLLSKLTSPAGEFRERPEEIEQLKLRLGLGELSGVARVDFDPATRLGMYRVYTIDRRPGPRPEILPAAERVVLFDGESRVITLLEGVTSKVMVWAPGPSKLDFAIMEYHASLDARRGQVILGDKLLRYTDAGVSEVITLTSGYRPPTMRVSRKQSNSGMHLPAASRGCPRAVRASLCRSPLWG